MGGCGRRAGPGPMPLGLWASPHGTAQSLRPSRGHLPPSSCWPATPGYIEPTVQYVLDAGGVAQEADYPYLAQNGWCRGPIVHPNGTAPTRRSPGGEAAPLSARFASFEQVPPHDEGALMEAVALKGPIAVLMNAARPPFKFYSSGTYFNPECSMVSAASQQPPPRGPSRVWATALGVGCRRPAEVGRVILRCIRHTRFQPLPTLATLQAHTPRRGFRTGRGGHGSRGPPGWLRHGRAGHRLLADQELMVRGGKGSA